MWNVAVREARFREKKGPINPFLGRLNRYGLFPWEGKYSETIAFSEGIIFRNGSYIVWCICILNDGEKRRRGNSRTGRQTENHPDIAFATMATFSLPACWCGEFAYVVPGLYSGYHASLKWYGEIQLRLEISE